jgi:hypothetical protein
VQIIHSGDVARRVQPPDVRGDERAGSERSPIAGSGRAEKLTEWQERTS